MRSASLSKAERHMVVRVASCPLVGPPPWVRVRRLRPACGAQPVGARSSELQMTTRDETEPEVKRPAEPPRASRELLGRRNRAREEPTHSRPRFRETRARADAAARPAARAARSRHERHERPPPRTTDDPPITVEVLEPGLATSSTRWVERDAQVALAEVAMARGNHPTDGFWRPPTEDGAPRVLNCSVSMSRGRFFDAVARSVLASRRPRSSRRAARPCAPRAPPTRTCRRWTRLTTELMVYYDERQGHLLAQGQRAQRRAQRPPGRLLLARQPLLV